MKTITKDYKVYTYDELSKEAKERARQDWIEDDELSFLSDDMQYKADELVKEAGIKGDVSRVFYSLSYCQGDGAMFEGDFEWKDHNIKVRHSGHYYHENSKDIEMTKDGEWTDEKEQEFDAIYIDICQELAKYGYDCIETSQSEENIRETFLANDYTFLENGEMFNN